MKKILLPLIAVLACMVSCQKDFTTLRLCVAPFENNSKVHMDGNIARWDNNDVVSVNGNDCTVSVSSSSTAITEVANATAYYAVYPASIVNRFTSGSNVYDIQLPETQTYNSTKVEAPMGGVYDGEELVFHNLGALLAINVTNEKSETLTVSSITVTDKNGHSLNGVFPLELTGTATDSIEIDANDGTETVILNCGGVSIAPNATKTFYVSIPVVHNAKFSIQVATTSNKNYTMTQTSTINCYHNKLYNVPFSMNSGNEESAAYTNIYIKTYNNEPLAYDDYSYSLPTGWTCIEDNSGDWDYILRYNGPITTIPEEAFLSTNISELKIPEGIEVIGEGAFAMCEYLVYVDLPSTLTSIENMAFYQNGDMYEGWYAPLLYVGTVICRSVNPPYIGFETDYVCFTNPGECWDGALYVPDEYVGTYEDSYWAWYFFNDAGLRILPLSELPE